MILITRPQSDALPLQGRLKAKKIKSIIEPLTSFKFINRNLKLNTESIYICASVRSVEALMRLSNKKIELNIIVIGKQVAALLKKNNFNKILFIASDTKHLMKWICKKKHKLQRYIYLSGSIVNNEFLEDLKKFKIFYRRKIIYKTIKKTKLSPTTSKNLRQKKITSVLFFSKTAVRVYFNLIRKNKMQHILNQQYFIVLSPRIANLIKKHKIDQSVIKISNKPCQASMLELLEMNKQLINNSKFT